VKPNEKGGPPAAARWTHNRLVPNPRTDPYWNLLNFVEICCFELNQLQAAG